MTRKLKGMRSSEAAKAVASLKPEAEKLGWSQGISLLTRTEAVVSKGGQLAGLGTEKSKLRRVLTESLHTIILTYAQYVELCALVSRSKAELEQAISTLPDDNFRSLSDSLREYATLHAYEDKKDEMHANLDKLDELINDLGDPEHKKQELDSLAEKSLKQMNTGIVNMVHVVASLLKEIESERS